MQPHDPAPERPPQLPAAAQPATPVDAPASTPDALDGLPQPVLLAQTRRPRLALIWLLPLVAVLVALSMAIHNWLNTGPVIAIHMKSAEGLAAGKSQIRYKEVVIGMVQRIALEENGEGVVVTAQLERSASRIANTGSRFWIVSPQLGPGGVSGLGTLLSGAYIGVDAGDYKNPRQTDFTALEQPPAVTRDSKGKRYYLTTRSLGSLSIGSPVYYRRMQVGRVTSYALEPSGRKLGVEIFVDQPYDAFVTTATRFWNASGVDVSVGSEGFKVNTESLAAIVAGGVAFGNMPRSAWADGAEDERQSAPASAPEAARFTLYDDRKSAMNGRDEHPVLVRMRYDQSVRGLTSGAPIELHGKAIGQVVETSLDFDPKRQSFYVWVDGTLYPRQLGAAFAHLQAQGAVREPQQQDRDFIRYLVEHGYRAQLKTGNLLTGQLYVSFEHLPRIAAGSVDWDAKVLQLPTAPGSFDQLQTQLESIATRLEKVRFDEIGADLQRSLQSAHKALEAANRSLNHLTPEARAMLVDAQRTLKSAEATMQSAQQAVGPGGLPDQAGEAMLELKKAARSLRSLGDYLQANPDGLLRGRSNAAPAIAPVPLPLPAVAASAMQP